MATFWVMPTIGNDANAGTSAGAAWATVQKALDTAVAGDTVRLCKSGDDVTSAVIDADTNAGTATNPIRFVSYDAPGDTPEDGFEIRASASMANLLLFAAASKHTHWTGVRINANGNATIGLNNTVDGSDSHTFTRCDVFGATGDGVQSRTNGLSTAWKFIDSDIRDNGGAGVVSHVNNRGDVVLVGTRIRNNGGAGVSLRRVCQMFRCIVSGNGADGVVAGTSSFSGSTINGCTFHGNTGDGLDIAATDVSDVSVAETAFTSNGAYGVNTGADASRLRLWLRNHANGNTSGAADATLPGTITGDPLYADAGAGDFTPGAGSPLIGAGMGGHDIGAFAGASGDPAESPTIGGVF